MIVPCFKISNLARGFGVAHREISEKMSVTSNHGRITPLQASHLSDSGPIGNMMRFPNTVSPPGLFQGDVLPEGTWNFAFLSADL